MENIIFLLVFLGLVAILVLVRTRTKNKFEIKVNDVVVALIPIFLFLFIRGDIAKFKIGDLEIEKAFKSAYASPIKLDLTTLKGLQEASITEDTEMLETAAKGNMNHLRTLANKNVQALKLKAGYAYYSAWAIEEYVRRMPSLHYFVVTSKNEAFYGLIPIENLKQTIEAELFSWDEFKEKLQFDHKALSEIPGYIGCESAVDSKLSRLETMERFEANDLKILPVTDANEFIGIVERDKLSTKLLINISRKLQNN